MHRWLQLGAASAGLSAALLGFSTLIPEIGTAGADTESTSTSAESSSDPSPDSSSSTSEDSDSAATDDSPDDEAEADDEPEPEPEPEDDDEAEVDSEPLEDDDEPLEDEPLEDDAEEPETVPDSPKPWAMQATSSQTGRQKEVADDVAAFMTSSQAHIAALPVSTPAKEALTGTLFTLRRAFLNQAPAVESVVQFTGSAGTPVQGRVEAVDPEGDRIVYRVVQGPKSGTVQVNSDGTYVFTPGSDFNGVETVVVAAYDRGLHVNLLDVFRAPGTRSAALVNQGAIRYDFDYATGSELWTAERRAALGAASDLFSTYFLVPVPIVLSFTVEGIEDSETGKLASAGSSAVSTEEDEIFRTVVQHKLITGEDANGEDVDGEITWNFAEPWALGASVGDDEFDFTAVVIHELMHSVGFVSAIQAPGANTEPGWTVYDSFIVTTDGTKVIGEDLTWNTDYDPNLLGGNGGLYFGGPNAVAANGGPVRLFTPTEYYKGSSVSHLSQRVFNGMVMVPGSPPGPLSHELSALELGVLKDIGFTVVAAPAR